MSFHQKDELTLDAVIPELKVHNQKQTYQEICKIAGYATRLNPAQLFDKLMTKEHEETSGIGGGVALAHLCVEGLTRPYTAFAKLDNPVEFDALDDAPVDLFFIILSPANDGPYHLRRLATFSRMLRNDQLLANLRGTSDPDTLYSLLLDPDYRRLAA